MPEHVFVHTGDRVRAVLATGRPLSEVASALRLADNTVDYHRDNPPPERPPVADLRHTVGTVKTRELVADLMAQGISQGEVARRLGLTKSTVSYHARRLGKPRDERGARRYDWVAV